MPTMPIPDLDHLEAEMLAARDQLARLEQERADLIVELGEFELIYNARLGPLQARLEETQLHIAEYQLRIDLVRLRGRSLSPDQLEAEVEYRLAEQRQRSESAQASAEQARKNVPAAPADPSLGLDLKQVYRELAKRTHPDLADGPIERAARSERMARINELYARRDLKALYQVLREIDLDRSGRAEDPEQRWARLTAEKAKLATALVRVKAEIAELNRGSTMQLKLDYALSKARGRDVLADLAVRMTSQLDQAEHELNVLIARFRELVESML